MALTFSDLSIREAESLAALDLTLPWVTRGDGGGKPVPYLGTNNLFLLVCRELAAAGSTCKLAGAILVALARALGLTREQADFFWTWARRERGEAPVRRFDPRVLVAKAEELAGLDGRIDSREAKLLDMVARLFRLRPGASAGVADPVVVALPDEVETSRGPTAPWAKVVAEVSAGPAAPVSPAAPVAGTEPVPGRALGGRTTPRAASPRMAPRPRPAPEADAGPEPARTPDPPSKILTLAAAATPRGRMAVLVLALVAGMGLVGLVEAANGWSGDPQVQVEELF